MHKLLVQDGCAKGRYRLIPEEHDKLVAAFEAWKERKNRKEKP